MFRVNNKTPEQRHWHCSGVFIVNFEHISHIFNNVMDVGLLFLFLTLKILFTFF